MGVLGNLRIHLCIWVRQSPTTVTSNPKSSANAHYRQMWRRHSASHCGASGLSHVPPRCAYTKLQSCLCCCTARRPGRSLEPSPPGLTALTVGLSDRFLAFTGVTSSPMKRCGPLPDSPQLPLWLPADGSAGMDMCFACHRTILFGLFWTSTLACWAGSDLEELHAPPGLTWSNAVLTSSASIQPQLNPSRRTVINGGLLWIWLAQRTTRRRAPCTRHDDDDDKQ